MKKILTIALLSLSTVSHALTVDTMLKISDENGSGVFTLNNELNAPSFVVIKPSKIVTTPSGELHRILYTKENLKDWEISLTQNKVILDPHRAKNVGVRSLCADGCDRSKDTVFAIKFLPSPYSKNDKEKTAVSINYGYEPIFVIPAKKATYKYDISRVNDQVMINNKSNSLLRIYIDECSTKNKKDCSKNIIALAGRKKTIDLPLHARDDVINMVIMGYDHSFYKKATLSRNSPVSRK